MTENPSGEVATKDHSSLNPRKGNPPDLKTKVDVSKVDVKGFPKEGKRGRQTCNNSRAKWFASFFLFDGRQIAYVFLLLGLEF